MTFSHLDQFGSMRILTSCVWIKKDAWPIQVRPICADPILGKTGGANSPAGLMKSDGIRTSVRKLRRCQSARGRNFTRVERLACAPFPDIWRTMFLRLFFEKGIGT